MQAPLQMFLGPNCGPGVRRWEPLDYICEFAISLDNHIRQFIMSSMEWSHNKHVQKKCQSNRSDHGPLHYPKITGLFGCCSWTFSLASDVPPPTTIRLARLYNLFILKWLKQILFPGKSLNKDHTLCDFGPRQTICDSDISLSSVARLGGSFLCRCVA